MYQNNNYTPRRIAIAKELQKLDFLKGVDHFVFFDVRLMDLDFPTPTRYPGLSSEKAEEIRFSVLLCHGGQVRAAVEPYRLLDNGCISYITGDAFTMLSDLFDGLPLLGRQSRESAENLAFRIRLTAQDSPWGYSFSLLRPWSLGPMTARQLIQRGDRLCMDKEDLDSGEDIRSVGVPTAYGLLQGITEGFVFTGTGFFHILGRPQRYDNIFKPHPTPPLLWEQLPLETRLERLTAGQPANLGHCAAVAAKIADGTVLSYMSHLKQSSEEKGNVCPQVEDLEQELEDLLISYKKAAVEIDRLMWSQETRLRGEDLMWDLAMCQFYEHKLKEAKKK